MDPFDEKENKNDEKEGEKHHEQDYVRDDAKDDRKDDPHEKVETVEQANIATEDGVDAHSKGDLKYELNEEKETLNLHGNPEEETARELVDNSPDDPKESDIVEATEDPDAPHADSTEHPSNEDAVDRSSPRHKTDFDIPDLERTSISPSGSLGPEQRVQKVQPDDLPDPESKEREMGAGKGCDSSENKTTSSVHKKNKDHAFGWRGSHHFFLIFESDHGGPTCII